MRTVTKPIADLTARDLMSSDLLLLSEAMPLRDAARMLIRYRISGAPVVNGDGRVVGVLSSSDFVRLAGREKERQPADESRAFAGAFQSSAAAERSECAQSVGIFCDWQMAEFDDLPADSVHRCMSRDVFAVSDQATVQEMSRKMVQAHIHRLVVVDGDHMPLGIVTSTDILNAVSQLS
jgi:predicted transcriptional regulator